MFYLSSQSENEGAWSLVYGGDSGPCGGSDSGNRGGGANSVFVVVVFTARHSQDSQVSLQSML